MSCSFFLLLLVTQFSQESRFYLIHCKNFLVIFPAGDRKIANLFPQCNLMLQGTLRAAGPPAEDLDWPS
jgi:hypothetical protein